MGNSNSAVTKDTKGVYQLKKDIKFIQLFTYSFGFLVGFGWIILTGQWITTAGGGGAALAFFLGGVFLVPIGLCYVELATAFPYPGGEFVYAFHAFGKGIAFIAGWVLLFLFVGLTAFETVAAAWIITILFPSLSGVHLYHVLGFDMTSGMFLIMILGTTTITWVNYRGSRMMANAQDIVTYMLVVITLVIILCGLFLGDIKNLEPVIHSDKPDWPLFGIISVFITTPIWYSGINALPQALSELQTHPKPRILSRLVTFMLLGSSLFYVLIILAVAMSSSREDIIGVDFATAFAIENIFASKIAGKIVLGAGLLGIISTWNAAHFAASRVLFALSRSHLVSAGFSKIHRHFGCPHIAVLFVGITGLAGASGGTPMIGAIVSSGVIVVSILFVLSCSSLFRVRKINPDASREYKVPGYPWLPLFGLIYAGFTVVFAFIVTWAARTSGNIPTEWLVLIVWSILGLLMWVSAKPRRDSISENDRAKIICGENTE